MNKLFTKIVGLSIGLAMAIGVGVAAGSGRDAMPVRAETTSDVLNLDFTGVSGTSYTSWSNKTGTSGAVYAGQSAGGNSSIQLRSNNSNSGIVTTTSGGKIKKVTIVWNSNTSNGRVVDIYGKNTAYTAATDLYNNSSKGTSLGSITCGTSTELTINDDYEYVGARSNSGALYMDSITFVWESGGEEDTRSDVTLSVDADSTSVEVDGTLSLDIEATSGGQVVTGLSYGYSTSNSSVATVNSSGVITGKTKGSATITVSFDGDTNYKPATATFNVTVTKKVIPLPSSGTIEIVGDDLSGSYGTDTPYTVNVKDSEAEFEFSCTDVMKNSGLQFKKNSGKLYSTSALSYIQSVTITGNSSLTITYGTSIDSGCTSEEVGTTNTYFKISNKTGNAQTPTKITIVYGPIVTLNSITAALDTSASAKTWHVNDSLTAEEVDVTTSYSDSSLNSTIGDGTGVFFDAQLTETSYTFSSTGNVSVPVYYRDANGRTANTSFTVNDVQPAKTVQAWSITGEIGDTAKTVDYDLSGLTLHAWYDTQKTDEASPEVASLYELAADPATAGGVSDPNNTINVEVYLKTDTSHSNRLALFEDVAAPIVDAPKGSEDNPYTVAEAMAAITWTENTSSDDKFYAIGFVKKVVNTSTNHSYFLVDDPNDTTSTDKQCLQAYSRNEPTGFDENATGDKVKVYGYLTYYNGQKEIGKAGTDSGNGFAIISVDPETLSLSMSVVEENVLVNETYSYSGIITADYKHKSDVIYDGVDSRFTITSNVNTAVVGDYTYSVTYDDGIFEEQTESCTVHVKYAEVSSVTMTEHNVPMGIDEGHQFTATLNEDVDPSNVIVWSVANDEGSEIPTSEFEIDQTGYLLVSTETPGTLIVTASCAGFSDHCTVTVTGDPFVTFNKESVQGIVGATLNNKITATPEGLGTPTGYTWTIKTGEATDVVSASTGSATSTLTFLKAGTTVLHVEITDGSKVASGDIDVEVIESLNEIIGGSSTDSRELSFDFSSLAEQGTSGSGSSVSFINDVITVSSDKAFQRPSNNHMKVYAGGKLTITASQSFVIKTITINQTTGYVKFDTLVENVDSSSWTQTNGSNSQARITSIVVTCEKTTEGTPINDTNFNAQKAVIEFAEDLTSKLDAVCLKGEGGQTVFNNLNAAWTLIKGTYTSKRNGLDLSDRSVFDALIANASADEGGDTLQKALSSYNYVVKKYKAQLTGGDFLTETGKAPIQAAYISPLALTANSINSTIIIIVISSLSAAAIGGYFLFRRRKEQ